MTSASAAHGRARLLRRRTIALALAGALVGALPAAPVAALGVAPSGSEVDPRLTQPLYVDTESQALEAVRAAKAAGNTALAAKLKIISSAPQARWVGDWGTLEQTRASVAQYVKAARTAKRTPAIVVYAIPNRDCGGYSGGGLTPETYPGWIAQIAKGLTDGAVSGSSRAIVLLEPDALMSDCADATRNRLLKDATAALAATGAWVYLDAGHSNWRSATDTAARLKAAGVGKARGFFTNVSNFNATSDEQAYGRDVGTALSRLGVGSAHRHFVVDTSRNGQATANGQWCNPPGQGLGRRPALSTAGYPLDGLLWVKRPGESDGACNGGPAAGQWWQQYALDLVRLRAR
ncbi:glycoside hydrolase family 6 protein [Cellulomonas composti]|uniref:glycoside hydrolase family 6 protein n=1 Tax=Cellulomonas composti TaxID=266130 RepID=UPI001649C48D|nr:glycoside hydrolase family 6 protein [Cellulomonas composti]